METKRTPVFLLIIFPVLTIIVITYYATYFFITVPNYINTPIADLNINKKSLLQ